MDAPDRVISPNTIKQSILTINSWHENTPLLLVFSRQAAGERGDVSGNVQAVRDVYNSLFGLERIGVADDARKFYLHMCHGKVGQVPFAIRKPTDNYGKTHQRIIKDTFGQNFLTRIREGKYTMSQDLAEKAKTYLKLEHPLDLKPLVLFHYWDRVTSATTIGELWKRFVAEFNVDKPPFDELFTCSGLDLPLDLAPVSEYDRENMKHIVLPDVYGTPFTIDFWKRFRTYLVSELRTLRWQGDIDTLASNIAAALLQDQALFLLGAPGTGKTTVVRQALLPALRRTYGTEREVRFVYYSITPETTPADLFGFQGLDGNWIPGPLARELLVSFTKVAGDEDTGSSGDVDENMSASVDGDVAEGGVVDDAAVPRLLFLDEANRVDVEGLLSPAQAAFDQLQLRREPDPLVLGQTEYVMPSRVWRVFAGNSPAADIGRREQSRPFKRRLSIVVPPDPVDAALVSDSSFTRMALDLLDRVAGGSDPEVSEPAGLLRGVYTDNAGQLHSLRQLLQAVRDLPRVPVTVGLVESILLRAAAQRALGQDSALDAALTMTLVGLIAGERSRIDVLRDLAQDLNFGLFAKALSEQVLGSQTAPALDIDSVL